MRILISAILICGFALTSTAQEVVKEKKIKSGAKETKLSALSLDELLAQALKENPDIRVSDAKVREAEAELNRTKLAVMQKVTQVYSELRARKATLAEAKARLERNTALYKNNMLGQEELGLARLTVEKAEAEVADLEAQLPYLIGRRQPVQFGMGLQLDYSAARQHTDVWGGGFRRYIDLQAQPRGTMADKIRKVLDTPITGEWRDTPVHEIVTFFGKKFQAEEINFFNNVTVAVKPPGKGQTVTMEIKHPLPIGAALQFLEDLTRLHFVIREYGVVLAPPESLPPGAVYVIDFWKRRTPVPAGLGSSK